MTRFPILLLLVSCAHVPSVEAMCVTHCGMRAPSSVDCAGLQEVESRTLGALHAAVPGWGYERTCPALRGWEVVRHNRTEADRLLCANPAWLIEGTDACILGYTHAYVREFELPDFNWKSGYLSHEIMHAIQVGLGEFVGHCDWEARRIKLVLRYVTGREDSSADDVCAPVWTIPPTQVRRLP